jgi:hypothetical protein
VKHKNDPAGKFYATYCIPCENSRRAEFKRKQAEKKKQKKKEQEALGIFIREPIPRVKKEKIPKIPRVKKEKIPKPIRTDKDRLHIFNKLSVDSQQMFLYLLYKNIPASNIQKIININEFGDDTEKYLLYKRYHYISKITYLPKWDINNQPPEKLKEILTKLNITII